MLTYLCSKSSVSKQLINGNQYCWHVDSKINIPSISSDASDSSERPSEQLLSESQVHVKGTITRLALDIFTNQTKVKVKQSRVSLRYNFDIEVGKVQKSNSLEKANEKQM